MELSCPQFRRSLGSSLVEEVTWLWSGRGVDAPQSPGPSSQGPAASVGTIYDCLSLPVSCMVYGISHCGSLWLDNQASTLLRLPQLLPMVADDHRNLFFSDVYKLLSSSFPSLLSSSSWRGSPIMSSGVWPGRFLAGFEAIAIS